MRTQTQGSGQTDQWAARSCLAGSHHVGRRRVDTPGRDREVSPGWRGPIGVWSGALEQSTQLCTSLMPY